MTSEPSLCSRSVERAGGVWPGGSGRRNLDVDVEVASVVDDVFCPELISVADVVALELGPPVEVVVRTEGEPVSLIVDEVCSRVESDLRNKYS